MTVCWADKTNKPLFFTFLLLVTLFSCQKKESSIGADFVGQRTPFNVGYRDTTTLVAYTSLHDSIPTKSLTYYMLGDLNDPEIGTTKCNIITQVSLPYDQFDFGANPKIDSIVLQLPYLDSVPNTARSVSATYGVLNSPQTINVYELAENLSTANDSLYFSNREYLISPNLIGQYTGTFEGVNDSVRITLDSVTTVLAPHLRIKLDNQLFVDRFSSANAIGSDWFRTNEYFQTIFKGFIIRASGNPAPGNGCIAYMNLRSSNCIMVVYYNGKFKAEFPIYSNSVHANKFNHTFSSSVKVEPLFSSIHSDVNYMQPATGLKTRITFPYLYDYVKDHKIAVTGAELILTIKSGTTNGVFTAPNLVRLLACDSLGRNDFILDQFVSSIYYGGTIENGTTYRFNVVRQLQYIIDEYQNNHRNSNRGLNLLVPGDNPITAQRVILDTRRGLGTFKLNLTYTVIK